ncbi:MAG: hypothetical protein JNK76_03725 [Planctomycetales bacterium]|nr:hypothetical protein [Planctomycetales bacterium]
MSTLPRRVKLRGIGTVAALRTERRFVRHFVAPVIEENFEVSAALLMWTATVEIAFVIERQLDRNANTPIKSQPPEFPREIFKHVRHSIF